MDNYIENLKVACQRRMLGLKKLKEDRKYLVVFLVLIMGESILYFLAKSHVVAQDWHIFKYSLLEFSKIVLLIIFITLVLFTYKFISTPLGTRKHQRKFQSIGLCNRLNQTPALLYRIKKNGITTFEYYCRGIPLTKFQTEKDAIETALNLSIADIRQGKNKSRVIVVARSGNKKLPKYIEWDDTYLQKESNKIVLGVDMEGFKIVDLDVLPMVQCGGETGSGKTVLLQSVLYQLYKNHAEIYLVDFKGGVDFSKEEKAAYHYISTKVELLQVLNELVQVLEDRKKIFADAECANITKYNQKHPNLAVKRIFLASDEIAYAFQKKGLKGADKEDVERIEAQMTLLAQQGRFAGIHLWLSTQRGDADTIPPQIRSNMNVRICGRASELLSRVTIDNSLASNIPEDIKGRFVDSQGKYFQGFYMGKRKERRSFEKMYSYLGKGNFNCRRSIRLFGNRHNKNKTT